MPSGTSTAQTAAAAMTSGRSQRRSYVRQPVADGQRRRLQPVPAQGPFGHAHVLPVGRAARQAPSAALYAASSGRGSSEVAASSGAVARSGADRREVAAAAEPALAALEGGHARAGCSAPGRPAGRASGRRRRARSRRPARGSRATAATGCVLPGGHVLQVAADLEAALRGRQLGIGLEGPPHLQQHLHGCVSSARPVFQSMTCSAPPCDVGEVGRGEDLDAVVLEAGEVRAPRRGPRRRTRAAAPSARSPAGPACSGRPSGSGGRSRAACPGPCRASGAW